MLRVAEDPGSARWPANAWIRRGIWRSAARRGEVACEGADLFFPRWCRAVGSEESASGVVEPVQRKDWARGEHPRLSSVELDRAGYLALHPSREDSDRAAVLCEGAADARPRREPDSGGAAVCSGASR